MMSPPIVGVPRLPRWVEGPSVRTICPTLSARSRATTKGPRTNAMRSAVTTAAAARNEM